MDFTDLNDIYDILKNAGYINDDTDSDSCSKSKITIDPTGGAKDNCCANINLDIPGGFQDINPEVFVVIGEILGNIIAGKVPFNVAVAISNWLNLVGQIIETYGAQQQYWQNGPGRYFDLAYKNVSNPFCTCTTEESTNTSSDIETIENRIDKLTDTFNELSKEMDNIKSQIEKINNKLK